MALEHSDGERILRAEVPVEGRLRNACLGHDAIDAHRHQAVPGEELVRSREDALARIAIRRFEEAGEAECSRLLCPERASMGIRRLQTGL